MKPWIDVYIGLGSNLHNPIEQAEQAIIELARHRHLRNVNASSLYSSKPVGPQDQPDYVNAAVFLQTQLGSRPVVLWQRTNSYPQINRPTPFYAGTQLCAVPAYGTVTRSGFN
jgi:7,8-dihydro-6-hydroxymethylpterin-pyrophosphokinase